MRQWHRRLSIFVAVFMFFIASTGALLQAESMLGGDDGPGGPPPPQAGAAGPQPPAGASDEQIQALMASALAGVHRQTHGGTILGIELRFSGAPTAEVVVADPQMRRLRLDARTGKPLDESSKPGGRDLHGILLDLHRGAFAGSAGLWISLFCGVVLVVLSVTGLTIYLQAWLRRRANGQNRFVW
jgi:hypothetical protein